MKVKLIAHTPNPHIVVATAGRVCYSSLNGEYIFENIAAHSNVEVEKTINILLSSGHLSTFEHVNFTFAIDGISRSCSHQLVRHRLASYSQKSQRYIKFGNSFIIPDAIWHDQIARSIFEETTNFLQEKYDLLIRRLIKLGKTEKEAQEDARSILPNAAETGLIMTMNARELLHFINMRGCRRAQAEIHRLAWKLWEVVFPVAPLLFAQAGPNCVYGHCKEGKLTCGKPMTKEEIDKFIR